MAVRAALGGYLIISTIHDRNKFAVVGRMMELGITQQQFYSVLTCIVYQRLIMQKDRSIKAYRYMLSGEDLLQAIKIPQSNFGDWHQLLQLDYQRGLLDDQTYQQFYTG